MIHYMQNCFEKKLAKLGISKFKNLKNKLSFANNFVLGRM